MGNRELSLGCRIHIVEDNVMNREIAQELFEMTVRLRRYDLSKSQNTLHVCSGFLLWGVASD